MTTYRFEEVSHTAKRRVTCAVCGKKFNRQKTFTNTINPFNMNANGSPKTYQDVRANVFALARQWQPEADCGKHEASS
jgi:uncharacterized protein (DUF2225 family)